jgi:acetyl esterase/lipase
MPSPGSPSSAHARPARRRILWLALAAGAVALAACSPTTVLNAWAPAGTYTATTDVAYGRQPRQKLDIYRPAHAREPAPVIVFYYGGNWNSGDRGDYLFVGESLASRGFIAVLPDYRLYPDVRFPAFLDDAAQAVRWTIDHVAAYGGDPRRVFLMGHSAGAYNAAMLALDPGYLCAAGVDPRQIRGLIGLAGPYDFLPLQARIPKAVFGFPDTPVTTQPIHFVTPAAPPALLVTGTADDIVDPGNAARLGARLRDNGVPVREVVYPEVGHRALVGALAAPLRSFAPVLDDVAGFVDAIAAQPAPPLRGDGCALHARS